MDDLMKSTLAGMSEVAKVSLQSGIDIGRRETIPLYAEIDRLKAELEQMTRAYNNAVAQCQEQMRELKELRAQ